MELPLVSVIVPAYNASRFLPGTLDSILVQSYPEFEILVVDDGSTDPTGEVVAPHLGSGRLRLLTQANSGGPARPRNVGVQHARGDLVSFFDSDDLMLPEKLSASVEVLAAHPHVDFVFSSFRSIDEQGRLLESDYLAKYRDFRRCLVFPAEPLVGLLDGRAAYGELLRANFIGTSSVVCRRAAFDRVGLFDEAMPNADDVDMWLRIAYAGVRFAFLDRALHDYRVHPGGVTGRGVRRYPAILKGLRKQLGLDLSPLERSRVLEGIESCELSYAYELRRSGEFARSRGMYASILARRPSAVALRGYARALFLEIFCR